MQIVVFLMHRLIFKVAKIENVNCKNFELFYIFAHNIECGYMLEMPQRGGSNEYSQCMFWSKKRKEKKFENIKMRFKG